MKFEDQFIDQVRNSVSIVNLVGGYVRLKKSGKDFSALCPFHTEKTPSFLVSENKQIFKCFGCGAGGDVFKFVMLIENLTFPEAIEFLAEHNGIPLPRGSKAHEAGSEDRSQLLKIMEIATAFFLERLKDTGGAMAYLLERQIDPKTIEGFKVGFAPAGNQLLNLLGKKGFSPQQLLACGLIKESTPGQYYDKFRNRVMFPIRDLSSRTIAFGGRILGEGLPKYLNSPETLLYTKSSNLYALEVTKEEIRKQDFAILVEGYFDCVVPYQFGIRNIVASLGTSLTQNQVKILARYTRNVVVNYDPDSAGLAAAVRSIDLFLEHGFRVNVLQLPQGQDPDTFVRSEGAESYRERLKSSVPYLDFVLERLIQEHVSPFSPKGKQEIVYAIMPYLAKMPNRIERNEYVTRVAGRLQLDAKLVLEELRKLSPQRSRSTVSAEHEWSGRSVTGPWAAHRAATTITIAETTLLKALFESHYLPEILPVLGSELFDGLETERIFNKAFELKQQNQEITIINLRKLLEAGEDLDLIEKVALESSRFFLSEETVKNSIDALKRKQEERTNRILLDEIKKEGKLSAKSAELLQKKEAIRKNQA